MVPYQWFRHKDNVDYSNIRWNNRKYYEEDLNQLLVIEERDNLIIEKFKLLKDPEPKKTLAFCVNIEHSHRFAEALNNQNLNAAVIHSNTNSASEFFLSKEQRKKNTQDFIDDKINVACVVDIFNEGIDIEKIDCLLLLRPTNSSTIAIQQFGRGLRLSDNKFKLRVMDFVGQNQRNALGVFEGVTGTVELPEKELFYYDNNGNEIIFEKEVIDIFRQEEALYSPTVDLNRVPERWKDWGKYIKAQAGANMYPKLGNHKKDIITQLEGCKIYSENPDISTKHIDKKLKKAFEDTSGTRTMIVSRHLGLLDKDNNKPTNVYQEILKRTKDFKNVEKYLDIIEIQLEKFCYWNRNSSHTDTRNPDAKLFNKKFKNFLILTLYKVILIIGDKTKNYEISYNEYRLFIFISRNYNEFRDIADHILSLRKETEKPLIVRYLNDQVKSSPTKLDDRFYQLFPYIPSLIFNKEEGYIRIKDVHLERIKTLIKNFETKLEENKIPFPLENGERGEYEEMLYNPKPFWE